MHELSQLLFEIPKSKITDWHLVASPDNAIPEDMIDALNAKYDILLVEDPYVKANAWEEYKEYLFYTVDYDFRGAFNIPLVIGSHFKELILYKLLRKLMPGSYLTFVDEYGNVTKMEKTWSGISERYATFAWEESYEEI